MTEMMEMMEMKEMMEMIEMIEMIEMMEMKEMIETIEMIEMKGKKGKTGKTGNAFFAGPKAFFLGVLLSPAYCRIRRSFPASSICGENLQFWKPSRSLKAQHTYLCR